MDNFLKAAANVHCKEGKTDGYSGGRVWGSPERSSVWQQRTSNWQSLLRSAANIFALTGRGTSWAEVMKNSLTVGIYQNIQIKSNQKFNMEMYQDWWTSVGMFPKDKMEKRIKGVVCGVCVSACSRHVIPTLQADSRGQCLDSHISWIKSWIFLEQRPESCPRGYQVDISQASWILTSELFSRRVRDSFQG